MVDVATIDAIVSGARQFGGQTGMSWVRFFRDGGINRGGYSHHKFSRYASVDEAPDTFNPDTLGRELWQENLLSIHARYPDTVGGENVPGAYTDQPIDAAVVAYEYGPGSRVVEVDPLGLLGAIRGYEYQACEHEGWRFSVAHAFCEALQSEVIHYLIDATGAHAWTVDDLSEISGSLSVDHSGPGWVIRFTPGSSAAVSLLEHVVRGR